MQPPRCSAAILAGGKNSRMGGKNKAFLRVGEQAILERILEALSPHCFAEILLVTREPSLYQDWPVRVVSDIYPDRSSLTGIHAALAQARTEFVLVVPCDAPFIQPALIGLLLAELGPDSDLVIPLRDGWYEPLCAIYSKRCLPPIEAQLDQGDYKILRFFPRVRVKTLPVEKLETADGDLISFFNVNTPALLQQSRQRAKRQGARETGRLTHDNQ